jgi:hypothetical protein
MSDTTALTRAALYQFTGSERGGRANSDSSISGKPA